ncbi:MAG: DNA mismatch repair protein MutS [Bacteroidia bacterium]|nr:DNA mismatch repair protein MutS [Bacteroidia bacterium]
MTQWNAIKAKHPGALLLFRVGDFYETFGSDAIKTSEILGIVLTKRSNGASGNMELAGFPHHSLDTYLPKLVRAGQRVAICDQLEDPKLAKTIVKRGVTEVVTPGISFNDTVLNQKENNYLASLHFNKSKELGVAFLDVSTGEFLCSQGSKEYIHKLLQGFNPSEVIYEKSKQEEFVQNFSNKYYTYSFDDWVYTKDYGYETLTKHFGTKSLKGFGIDQMESAIIAGGSILHYIAETQHSKIQHVTSISRIDEDQYVWLDNFTIRNLEIINSPNPDGASLISVIDKTQSPMGARLLRRWLVLPLKEKKLIEDRLNVVSYFTKNEKVKDELSQNIKQIGDLERLTSKVAIAKINPRELIQLKRALNLIDPIKNICNSSKNDELRSIAEQLNPCNLIKERIEKEIVDDPPALLEKGGVMAEGVSKELDELRQISSSGKDYLIQIKERESKATGITSLKVGFNNVFGYYIEVTNSHKDKVPENWMRKQTLTNAERYITEELKEYEQKILGAEEKIKELENQLYTDLILSLADHIQPIQLNANLIARIDCLQSFADLALTNNYVCPKIEESFVIDIKDGRHPVIEQEIEFGEEYIPNDVYLDNKTHQLLIITGPNMSGKSALLRQTALICLMAQIGSFVPAKSAKLGIVDKIFTRVGASDNISSGESTFMVEMNETASILNNITDRSLVLLDEIGRGTSTYDGISIAWAIAEYLHENPNAKPKVLFATHYHELNEMANDHDRIKNFNVSVKEMDNKVIFMRKLKPGGSAHSFGIHVARMAGIPPLVIDRANEILVHLENERSTIDTNESVKTIPNNMQLNLFQLDDPVLKELKEKMENLDVNTLTPIEALMKLNELKGILKK